MPGTYTCVWDPSGEPTPSTQKVKTGSNLNERSGRRQQNLPWLWDRAQGREAVLKHRALPIGLLFYIRFSSGAGLFHRSPLQMGLIPRAQPRLHCRGPCLTPGPPCMLGSVPSCPKSSPERRGLLRHWPLTFPCSRATLSGKQ